jgi:riboflavin transporter FmnP
MLVGGIEAGTFFIDTFFIDIAAGFGVTLLATITWLLLVLGPNIAMGGIIIGSAVTFGMVLDWGNPGSWPALRWVGIILATTVAFVVLRIVLGVLSLPAFRYFLHTPGYERLLRRLLG